MADKHSLTYAFGGTSLVSPEFSASCDPQSIRKLPDISFWNKHANVVKVLALLCLLGVLCYFIYSYRKQSMARTPTATNLLPADSPQSVLDNSNNNNAGHSLNVPLGSPYNTQFFQAKLREATEPAAVLTPHSAVPPVQISTSSHSQPNKSDARLSAETPALPVDTSGHANSAAVTEAYTNGRLEVLQQLYEKQIGQIQNDLRSLKGKLSKNFQGLVTRLEELENMVHEETDELPPEKSKSQTNKKKLAEKTVPRSASPNRDETADELD